MATGLLGSVPVAATADTKHGRSWSIATANGAKRVTIRSYTSRGRACYRKTVRYSGRDGAWVKRTRSCAG